VTFSDGTGVGSGFATQLSGGPVGASLDQLTPLFPMSTFRTSSLQATGYIFGVDVAVPGVPPGETALLVMRAFNGAAWDASTCRGESNPVVVRLAGGGGGIPAQTLQGLQPFQVDCIPEPSTIALFGCGGRYHWRFS
jgi:hypothetical protein